MDARSMLCVATGSGPRVFATRTTGGAPFTTLSNQGVIERITIASREARRRFELLRITEVEDIPTAIIAIEKMLDWGALEQFEAEPPSRV